MKSLIFFVLTLMSCGEIRTDKRLYICPDSPCTDEFVVNYVESKSNSNTIRGVFLFTPIVFRRDTSNLYITHGKIVTTAIGMGDGSYIVDGKIPILYIVRDRYIEVRPLGNQEKTFILKNHSMI